MRWFFPLLFAAACAPEPRELALPAVEGMKTALLFSESVEGDGTSTVDRGIAFDPNAPDNDVFDSLVLAPKDEVRYNVRLTALYYLADRSALELSFGPLVPSDSGRYLPQLDEGHTLTITSGEPSEWTEVTVLNTALSQLRYTQ
jgi:hypothetical protein